MLSIIKWLLVIALVVIDIACIKCSFTEKVSYPYFIWFFLITVAIFFIIL